MTSLSELILKKNLSVGVFGLGKSNLGVIEYLKKKNPSLKLTLRSDQPIECSVIDNAQKVFIENDSLNDIDEDILFLSPTVKRERHKLRRAEERGTILSSDAELFFEKTNFTPICVTGSDGKSTTTHLIAAAHTLSGIKATPCGNYGKALCTLLDTDAFPIAELSSFQLNYMTPRVSTAVITNITPNHLNWHASVDEYTEAKMNAVKNAKKTIFDADSNIVSRRLLGVKVFAKASLNLSYGELKREGYGENYITYKNGIIYLNGSPFCDISRAKRQEPYNIRNFMLTVAACMEKCSAQAITETVLEFSGLEHRAELFFEKNGIRYINSSIDSSPERTIKTLSGLANKPVAIIGGLGKGLSLERLASALPALTLGAVLLGEVGYSLSLILSKQTGGYKFTTAENMRDAVIKAKEFLNGKGTVILSPAATSFDSYKNFAERGNDFKSIVLSL